ncbi:MAG TPA: hypothetical protein DDX71_00675 [Ruminococcus sp.]|nr:hypothetical protein [Ruminococcus sp.]
MAQFSRLVSQIDALLDELVAARGSYATLGAAIEAKAGEEDLAEIAEALDAVDAALAGKIMYGIATVISATQASRADLNTLTKYGSYQYTTQDIPYIDNLPTGVSSPGRIDVIVLPAARRQQILRTTGGAAQIIVRNSTSAPTPVTTSLIPTMTGMTSPSGEVIESGHYESRYGWQAFDGVDAQTYAQNAWGDGTNVLDGTPEACFVGYIWGSQQTVASVKISFYSDTSYTGIVQCRVDGEWQTVLDSVSIVGGAPYYSVVERTFSAPITCDGIRMCVVSGDRERFCTASYGGNVCEFTVYGDGGTTATWGTWKRIITEEVQAASSTSNAALLVASINEKEGDFNAAE